MYALDPGTQAEETKQQEAPAEATEAAPEATAEASEASEGE